MTDPSALIARLEAAEAGSRELDGAVWYAIHEPDVQHGCLHVEQTEQGPMEVLTCELGSKYADCVGNYTTSLDAALALAERALPGWGFFLRKDKDGCNCGLLYPDAHFVTPGCGSSPTPALALVIAILRAKQGEV